MFKFLFFYLTANILAFLYATYCLIVNNGSFFFIPYVLSYYMLDAKVKLTKKSRKIELGKVIYFSNHRGWTDFFLDTSMLGGCSYLSRAMVILAVPGAAFLGYILGACWFFKRSPGIDRKKFGEWMLGNWAKRSCGLIIYPEGHRTHGDKLPLKTGCTEVAFTHKIPIQIVITKNKESLFDEKTWTLRPGQVVTTSISEYIDPKESETLGDFIKKVQEVWDSTWEDAYNSTDIFDSPLLLDGTVVHYNKPVHRFPLYIIISIILLVLYLIYK